MVSKKKKRSSPILRLNFRPKSQIQRFFSPKIRWSPKKKKKVFTEIESDFSAEIVRFRLVGGDASPNGAELFQIEADFSAEIVTFRLVEGGCIPPIPPPLNPPLVLINIIIIDDQETRALLIQIFANHFIRITRKKFMVLFQKLKPQALI